MSNLKIIGVALVAVLGATSIASAAPRHDQRDYHNYTTDRALDNVQLQEGRTVYEAPIYQDQAPTPITQLDGSNAPGR